MALSTVFLWNLWSSMPLHWTMESKIQLVTVVAEGDVTRSDVEAYIAMSSGGERSRMA
jgi:hypothetical protein